MESKGEMINILNEIIQLLETSREDFWLVFFNNLRSNYYSNDPDEKICSLILKSFQGGMGSFNDLVLHKNGLPLIEENNKLEDLKERLFDYCSLHCK